MGGSTELQYCHPWTPCDESHDATWDPELSRATGGFRKTLTVGGG